MAMRSRSALLRRALVVGLVAGALLSAAAGIVVWRLAAAAHRRLPSAGWADLEPPRLGFWDRVDLLVSRRRAAAAPRAVGLAGRSGPAGGQGYGKRSPAAAEARADPFRDTAETDQRELAEALAALDMPEARRRSLLDDYHRLRNALLGEDEAAAAARLASPGLFGWAHPQRRPRRTGAGSAVDSWPAGAPRAALAGELAMPAGLPAEFAAYLAGALAYRDGDLAAARDHWRSLLALPEEQRHYRTTWAAFMLGQVALRAKPPAAEEAVSWFQRTRELAASGFADSLGLAVASLGWEARAEIARRRFDRAEALYAQQARRGDPAGLDSLAIYWRERLIGRLLGRY
jgi:hypothetical protein